jgi:hypothetical protein
MGLRKHIIRKGAIVKVKIPRFVARVGYPKSVNDYLTILREKHSGKLDELFYSITGSINMLQVARGEQEPTKQRRRVEQELAYLMAKRDHFGGRERTIHWLDKPEYHGVEMLVVEVCSAYTGIYYPPDNGGYNSWDGEYDYEPGGLTKVKCHRIARVRFCSSSTVSSGLFQEHFLGLEIPVYHLEKL